MRRSIELHEFRTRKQWDESLDPEGAANARVRVHVLDSSVDAGGNGVEGHDGGFDLEERRKRIGKREWWEDEDGDIAGDGAADQENDSEEARVISEWLVEENLV